MHVDTVVDGINLENEVFVDFLINEFKFGVCQVNIILTLANVLDDLFSKVLVNQTSRAQFGDDLSFLLFFAFFGWRLFDTTVPVLVKRTLMMIKSIFFRVKDTTNIALDVELVKEFLIARSHNN